MASKKPNQDPPVDPSDYTLACAVYLRGAKAALDAEDYKKLQDALAVIVELRRRYPKAGGLVKLHAGISNMCASMATDPQDIQLHRETAIACARDFVRCDADSKECSFYLAYFLKNLSFDLEGLNLAIEECKRGLMLADPGRDLREWGPQFHGLIALCDSKLDMLKQHTHQESQLGQRNLQKRKPIFKLEQPVDKIAKFVAASIPSKNTQPQDISDLDSEKIRRLVSSLPTGPGSEVVETARASSQEEQSRPQEIDVHVMSREVPVLFFEHVRHDLELMNYLLDAGPMYSVIDNLRYFIPVNNSDGVLSDDKSSY